MAGLVVLVGSVVAVAALGLFGWYAAVVPSSQVFGPALVSGPAQGRRVTLTFDDGPSPPYTEQILAILRERKISATFFVCGKNVERFPEIVRRIHAEGHTLGTHTYSHPFLYYCSRTRIAQEIDRTQDAIEEVTGFRPELFRPPYGGRWFGLYSVLRSRRMSVVQWSLAGHDWHADAEQIVSLTLRGLRGGAVILLHDGREAQEPNRVDRSNTVKALPAIIDGAIQKGFSFAALSDFLRNHPEA
jgi:peptidoglycan/xylan/chitin deacetylase (PgdA/CDA1 family)